MKKKVVVLSEFKAKKKECTEKQRRRRVIESLIKDASLFPSSERLPIFKDITEPTEPEE